MYLWKTDLLIEDLKNDTVSQREQFKYIFLFYLLTIIFMDPWFYVDTDYGVNDSYLSVGMVIATILGLIYCNKYNSDGKDLILRIVTLGFPVGIRFFCIFIPAIFVVVGLEEYLEIGTAIDDEGHDSYQTTWLQVVILPLLYAGYYWRVAVALHKVSKND